jgi:hypothetical protein
MPVIPTLGKRLRQKDYKFKANLGYIARACKKKKNTGKGESSFVSRQGG